MTVSIHAPREGCDVAGIHGYYLQRCFNSRTPGGVRPNWLRYFASWRQFQFTHPGRGATYKERRVSSLINVSIHAPREGCDRSGSIGSSISAKFQFTHPGRGATRFAYRQDQATKPFQFTHPGRGATGSGTEFRIKERVSIHAPREGCDSPSSSR